jgi:flavin reductase (DIM6/NTAB) family NADH-FMN oxidoreductase RutF
MDISPIDGALFRRAMASFASGVTVVTTFTEDGTVAGLTASAFSSLSLDPPLVLVCPALTSRTLPHILARRQFAIHILADGQSGLATTFARSGADLSGIDWTRSPLGNPLLEGAACIIECSLWANHDGGDHAILVGQVQAIDLPEPAAGTLLYHRGALTDLPAPALGADR